MLLVLCSPYPPHGVELTGAESPVPPPLILLLLRHGIVVDFGHAGLKITLHLQIKPLAFCWVISIYLKMHA